MRYISAFVSLLSLVTVNAFAAPITMKLVENLSSTAIGFILTDRSGSTLDKVGTLFSITFQEPSRFISVMLPNKADFQLIEFSAEDKVTQFRALKNIKTDEICLEDANGLLLGKLSEVEKTSEKDGYLSITDLNSKEIGTVVTAYDTRAKQLQHKFINSDLVLESLVKHSTDLKKTEIEIEDESRIHPVLILSFVAFQAHALNSVLDKVSKELEKDTVKFLSISAIGISAGLTAVIAAAEYGDYRKAHSGEWLEINGGMKSVAPGSGDLSAISWRKMRKFHELPNFRGLDFTDFNFKNPSVLWRQLKTQLNSKIISINFYQIFTNASRLSNREGIIILRPDALSALSMMSNLEELEISLGKSKFTFNVSYPQALRDKLPKYLNDIVNQTKSVFPRKLLIKLKYDDVIASNRSLNFNELNSSRQQRVQMATIRESNSLSVE